MDHENVRPDLVLLGKALSGGLYPVRTGDPPSLCSRIGPTGQGHAVLLVTQSPCQLRAAAGLIVAAESGRLGGLGFGICFGGNMELQPCPVDPVLPSVVRNSMTGGSRPRSHGHFRSRGGERACFRRLLSHPSHPRPAPGCPSEPQSVVWVGHGFLSSEGPSPPPEWEDSSLRRCSSC